MIISIFFWSISFSNRYYVAELPCLIVANRCQFSSNRHTSLLSQRSTKKCTTKKLKNGEIYAEENRRGITKLNWRDKANVLILSTRHSVEVAEVQSRGGSKIKPKMITEYNTAKSSVDLSDQMGAYSNSLRKTIQWYRKLAFELLLTTSAVNAHIIKFYKQISGNNVSMYYRFQ